MRPSRPDLADDPVAAVLDAHRTGRSIALRTSGSTGAPRTVVRSTASWWSSFEAYSALSGVAAGARVWVPGPLTGTMNLFAAVHARAVEATLTTDPGAATHACLTPIALDRLSGALPRGTRVVVAGGPLSERQHHAATATGLDVVSYYGAAELSFVAAGIHAGALRPFPGVDVAIRDRVIWVRSPYLADGLGPWATVGDEGRLEDGRLAVLGRPGAVTTAGATVSLAVVEQALQAVARSPLVAIGLPHPGAGEVVTVVIDPDEDLAVLRAAARALPPAHRPRRWIRLAGLPLTPAGKVDRVAVRNGALEQIRRVPDVEDAS